MQDKLFFVDSAIGKNKTYHDLVSDLNKIETIDPVIKYENIYDFFCQLLAAIINDQEIYLLNKDYSVKEKEEILSSLELPLSGHNNVKLDEQSDFVELINSSSALIGIFTSGTTGRPKLIKHKLNSLRRESKVSERHSDDIWGLCYHPSHFAGLQVFCQAILNSNTIINLAGHEQSQNHSDIEKFGITHISGTPTFLSFLVNYDGSHNSVVNITSGGEKAKIHLLERIEQVFPNARFKNIYASTEVGSVLISKGDSFIVPDKYIDKVKILNGELLVHESMLAESLRKEGMDWFSTGDLVEVVNKDPLEFKFATRKFNMINVGGYKVNPEEVEQLLTSNFPIKDALVYGMENSVTGNILCCDIVLNPNETIGKKEIKIGLKEYLQSYKIPRIYKFVDSLKISKNGKKIRK